MLKNNAVWKNRQDGFKQGKGTIGSSRAGEIPTTS